MRLASPSVTGLAVDQCGKPDMDDGVFTFVYLNLSKGSETVVFTNSANGPKVAPPIFTVINQHLPIVDYLRRLTQ